MSSLRRIISSRANGARSKGATTPAGKVRSSRNATRHGLIAKRVVLENESREGFDSLLAEFVERFNPADSVELGLVEEMLSACWRQRRAWAIETRTLDNAISAQPLDRDELTRLAGAFSAAAAQPNLELMHRYETRLHRIFQRALANLVLMRSLQELRPPAEDIELPNDPSPISGQLPEPETEASEMPPESAAQTTPPAENIKLPNDPSPITGHLVQSDPQPQSRARQQAVTRRLMRSGFA